MDEKFEWILKKLLGIEGKFSDNKFDPGGKTNYGITQNTLDMLKINKKVEDLTFEDVKNIYYNHFYKKYNFDKIKNKLISYELFEFTVNTGNPKLAVKNLQRAFNVLNENILLKEDGILGPKTINFINNYKFYKSLYNILNIIQGMYYIALAENNDTLKNDIISHKETHGSKWAKKFIRGWIDKRVEIKNRK